MIIEMSLSGFLFLFIIAILLASERLTGYGTVSDLDSAAMLQKINSDPRKFRISIVFALVEHVSIISLAVLLFIAFSPYNMVLAVVWTVFRIGEGLIQIYNKRNYWRLLDIAGQCSGSSGAGKNALIDSGAAFSKQKTLSSHLHKSYSPLVRSHTQSCLLPMELYQQLSDGLELLPAFSMGSVTG